jgi:hypothetical protein
MGRTAFNSSGSDTVGAAAATVRSASTSDSELPPGLISKGWFTTLCRAWRAPDDQLTAHEAASTLFRFFRSQHVIDLKLIANLAILFLLLYFLFVVAFAVARPLFHICTLMEVHGRSEVLSTYGGTTGLIGHSFEVFAATVLPALGTYFAPAIPVCCAIIAWAYLSAAKRLGVVDLFGCEIRTLCRVGTAFDIGKLYIEMYDRGRVSDPPAHSNGFVSQEDYFPVFSSNSDDLQSLEAMVVGNITEFYTYMKAARDLQRKLAEAKSLEATKATLANLIYVLFLGYESGRKAVKDLVEFEPTQAENIIVILLTELICYSFLCKHFAKIGDHLRLSRLTLRVDDYNMAMADIFSKVEPRDADDKYWGPAKRTLLGLQERYKDMLDMLHGLPAEPACQPPG